MLIPPQRRSRVIWLIIRLAVCRMKKKSLALELRKENAQPGNAFAISDAEMFKTLNVGGTGNATLEEFSGYFGVSIDDFSLKA